VSWSGLLYTWGIRKEEEGGIGIREVEVEFVLWWWRLVKAELAAPSVSVNVLRRLTGNDLVRKSCVGGGSSTGLGRIDDTGFKLDGWDGA
jgi:hypothetical protein